MGAIYWLIFFPPLFEWEYPKICAVKTQQCSIFIIFRIMQEKGCNKHQRFLHAGKQQMEIKLYHFFDDTVNLEGVFIVK